MQIISSLNVIDLLLDAVCIVDEDSRIVFVSPAFERIFGYTPQEAVGLQMLDLVHPEDRPRVRLAVEKARNHTELRTLKMKLLLPGERVRHLQVYAQAVANPQGVVDKLVGAMAAKGLPLMPDTGSGRPR